MFLNYPHAVSSHMNMNVYSPIVIVDCMYAAFTISSVDISVLLRVVSLLNVTFSRLHTTIVNLYGIRQTDDTFRAAQEERKNSLTEW